jgi:hypothetical protein
MVITFMMDHLLKQAPNGKLSNMNGQQVNDYLSLDREKNEKCDRLLSMMTNDHDIVLI